MYSTRSRRVPRWGADGGAGYVVDHYDMTPTDTPSPIADAFALLISALMRIDEILYETRKDITEVMSEAYEKETPQGGI